MDIKDLNNIVLQALDNLYKNDLYLISADVSEWAIAHRLAVYLEQEVPDSWNIDCEYNRQGSEHEAKTLMLGGKVRPDIIIHRRSLLDLDNNLLVIEMKKTPDETDSIKACEYTKPPEGLRQYQYQFGLMLSVIDEPQLTWFRGGRAYDIS